MHQQTPISYTASYSLHLPNTKPWNTFLYNLVSIQSLIMSSASQTGRVELLLRWIWPNVCIRHRLAIVHSWSAIICYCTASCNFALLRHPSHARLHLSPKSQPSRLEVHRTIIKPCLDHGGSLTLSDLLQSLKNWTLTFQHLSPRSTATKLSYFEFFMRQFRPLWSSKSVTPCDGMILGLEQKLDHD